MYGVPLNRGAAVLRYARSIRGNITSFCVRVISFFGVFLFVSAIRMLRGLSTGIISVCRAKDGTVRALPFHVFVTR